MVLLTQNSICENQHVFISAKKGNTKGNKNLAKFIYWHDIDGYEVKTFFLDVDCTDEDTNEIAGTLEHSIRRLFPTDIPVCIYGKCTYSGGGGALEALARVLEAKCLL